MDRSIHLGNLSLPCLTLHHRLIAPRRGHQRTTDDLPLCPPLLYAALRACTRMAAAVHRRLAHASGMSATSQCTGGMITVRHDTGLYSAPPNAVREGSLTQGATALGIPPGQGHRSEPLWCCAVGCSSPTRRHRCAPAAAARLGRTGRRNQIQTRAPLRHGTASAGRERRGHAGRRTGRDPGSPRRTARWRAPVTQTAAQRRCGEPWVPLGLARSSALIGLEAQWLRWWSSLQPASSTASARDRGSPCRSHTCTMG